MNQSRIDYPSLDSSQPFATYVDQCRAMIAKRRVDLAQHSVDAKIIIDANSPFESFPLQPTNRMRYGALLIHGLFDCPFSLRDIGSRLQKNGIVSRAILLPGHGTTPSDLLSITYQDWIQALRYGIASLKNDVDKLFIIGYSTGATLAVYEALHNTELAGLILLAPAIRIKAPLDIILGWDPLVKWMSNNRKWVHHEDEIDYAKYRSIALNPITELNRLTEVINDLHHQHPLQCPMIMIVSREDEVISSHIAIDFFSYYKNPRSKLLLYTPYAHRYPDNRIVTRQTDYPDLHIQHFSHVALPFHPDNFHYGQHGDYRYAARLDTDKVAYGAYNHLEEESYNWLYKMGIIKQRRAQLTYNPDFDFMANEIVEFILSQPV